MTMKQKGIETMPKTIDLPLDWSECERGNTLLVNESQMVSWIELDPNIYLEVAFSPENYPALNVSVVQKTPEELANHINTKLQGWTARKMNIPGVVLNDNEEVVGNEEENAEGD